MATGEWTLQERWRLRLQHTFDPQHPTACMDALYGQTSDRLPADREPEGIGIDLKDTLP